MEPASRDFWTLTRILMHQDVLDAVHACRAAEKEQALFYRTLAATAEMEGDEATSERLQQLHADEQHHLSRLTARLMELGAALPDLTGMRPPSVTLAGWETLAREREAKEVRRYEALLTTASVDEVTLALLEQILEVERHHARDLGGKWTMA